MVEKLDAAFVTTLTSWRRAVAGWRPLLTVKEAAPAKEETRQAKRQFPP